MGLDENLVTFDEFSSLQNDGQPGYGNFHLLFGDGMFGDSFRKYSFPEDMPDEVREKVDFLREKIPVAMDNRGRDTVRALKSYVFRF